MLLLHGEMISLNLTLYGSNYTFLVRLRNGDDECLGIYKPRAGEAPLWDFPHGTLYKREYASYLLSDLLGWDFIPLTVVREGPHGVGSLQLFVPHDPRSNYFTIKESHQDALKTIACFDLIANNADRKSSHCILGEDGKVWGIDHGLTFHSVVKVRSVIWDFSNEPIPEILLDSVEPLHRQLLNPDDKVQELLETLTPDEVAALLERTNWLVTNRTFPGLHTQHRA
jgi:hypothetical protein